MLERNQRDGLSIEDRLRLQWFFGGGLALIAAWALSPLPFGGNAMVLLLTAAVVAVMLRPSLSNLLSLRFIRIASPFIVIAVAADVFLSAPDFLPAIMRMLVLLLFFRACAIRSGREDQQLLLLSLFTVILSGVMTASILFAVQILLFSLLAMPLLFLRSQTELAGDLSETRATLWQGFRWSRFINRVRHQLNWKLLGFSIGAFITLTVLSSLIFVLIPRFQIERTIQLFQLNAQPRSGFSESIGLGNITEITLDNSIALRIDGPGRDAIPSRPYWRMLVLDEYRHGRFSRSSFVRISNDEHLRRRVTGASLRMDETLDWTTASAPSGPWIFYMEGNTSRFLPLPGAFSELRFAQTEEVFFYPAFLNLANRNVRSGVFSFRLESLQWADAFPVRAEEAALLADLIENPPEPAPPSDDPYYYEEMWHDQLPGYPKNTLTLHLRNRDRQTLQSILAEIFENDTEHLASLSARDFSSRIERWLSQRFNYSLAPDVPETRRRADPIVAWLAEGTLGHCELFAGAFLLLAREAGFPTRIVTGFAGGAWNAVENYFVVRNRHAHAWVEIYDVESQQWLRVDPTPEGYELSMAGIDAGASGIGADETGWAAWLDSLRILWYRRIVNFDHEEQTQLAQRFVGSLRNWQESTKATLREFWQMITNRSREWFGAAGELGLPLLILIVGIFLFIGMMRLWPWLRFSFNRKPALHPWRLQAGKLLRKLRKHKRESLSADTQAKLDALEKQLEAIRFGPLPDKSVAIKSTFKAARRAKRNLSTPTKRRGYNRSNFIHSKQPPPA